MTARFADMPDVEVREGDHGTVIYYPNGGWLRFRAVTIPSVPARGRTPARPAAVNVRHSDRTWTAAQLRDLAAVHVALADWVDAHLPDGQLALDHDDVT